jgi:tRNA threonylcarbamoyladenosine biosynthesis protein TsaB
MLVAAVDTSTLTLSCALLEVAAGRVDVVATRTDRPASPTGGHGGRLPGALGDLLSTLGKTVRDVEGWAVGLGPGSFTGLRIGLATWKGLAYANRRPIAGASSLAALALDAAAALPSSRDAVLVPLLDARKGEVYAGYYRREGTGLAAVLPEEAIPPAALASRLASLGDVVGFGEGYAAWKDVVAPSLPLLAGAPSTPSGDAVGRLAAARLLEAPFDDQALFALEPHYVRPSEAEVKFPRGLP